MKIDGLTDTQLPQAVVDPIGKREYFRRFYHFTQDRVYFSNLGQQCVLVWILVLWKSRPLWVYSLPNVFHRNDGIAITVQQHRVVFHQFSDDREQVFYVCIVSLIGRHLDRLPRLCYPGDIQVLVRQLALQFKRVSLEILCFRPYFAYLAEKEQAGSTSMLD